MQIEGKIVKGIAGFYYVNCHTAGGSDLYECKAKGGFRKDKVKPLVGDNVRKHPKEFQMIVERGHRLGNHTFNHIRGFEYRSKNYLANTDKANELIHTNLFRPPHGHMRWMQYMVLRHKYQIVMWDLVTRDYSNKLNGRQVLRKVKHYVRNGSIITFHDSIKAEKNMKYALPRAIEWLLEQGYEFKVFD